MAAVTVTIPRMLAELVACDRTLALEADTVAGTLQALIARHPELAVHIFDEEGAVRRHVSVFHNDALRFDLADTVGEGDRVTVLQAVSGGDGVAGASTRPAGDRPHP